MDIGDVVSQILQDLHDELTPITDRWDNGNLTQTQALKEIGKVADRFEERIYNLTTIDPEDNN